MLSKEWYEEWYRGKEKIFGWNIGRPHIGLMEVLDKEFFGKGRVLVPGCGIGYNAILLAQKGFEVVAFDFSVNAIKKAKLKAKKKKRLKGRLRFEVEDIYSLPASYLGAFDYIVEIGNFQAMSVKERREYVRVLYRVLAPSGKCIVICKKYPPLTPGPKGIKKASLQNYFSSGFEVEHIDSVLMYRNAPPPDGLRLIARRRK